MPENTIDAIETLNDILSEDTDVFSFAAAGEKEPAGSDDTSASRNSTPENAPTNDHYEDLRGPCQPQCERQQQ